MRTSEVLTAPIAQEARLRNVRRRRLVGSAATCEAKRSGVPALDLANADSEDFSQDSLPKPVVTRPGVLFRSARALHWCTGHVRTRWFPVLSVLLLSPVCAEYLSAYDASASGLLTMLAGLLVLAPLYGAPALIAHEIAVRRGLGWPGLLLVVTALGVLQAVVIDQSVVNADYRNFEGWSDFWQPTYVPALDLSAYAAVAFVLGHTVASFGAPLAIVAVVSRDGARPWLGRRAALILGVLYLAAAGLVLGDHVSSEGWQLSMVQLVGALVVVALLMGVALGRSGAGQSRTPPPRAWRPPPPGLLVLVGMVVESALGWSIVWPALVVTIVGLAVLAIALVRWGRSRVWTSRHVAALAVGVLLSRALGGFLVDPVDGGRTTTTYFVNVGATLLVMVVAALALRATRQAPGLSGGESH